MKTLIYSYHGFDRPYFGEDGRGNHRLSFTDRALTAETASLSADFDAVSLFSNDDASGPVLELLHAGGVRFIALRSAGYDHVDLATATRLGIRVAHVPAYSPFSVAEHAVMLMLALNRKLIRSHSRMMDHNFSLTGLTGFDMNGKTAGIVGTGRIGSAVARILHGFGCRLLAFDIAKDDALKQRCQVTYVDRETLYRESDIVTLHVPLSEQTRYLVDRAALTSMKPGVMLINTSRGGLVNTAEVIRALKSGHIGYFGADVYEHERGLFFEDRSDTVLQDDMLAQLLSFPNVLLTGHQAFLTDTALGNICETTFYNLDCFANGTVSGNELTPV